MNKIKTSKRLKKLKKALIETKIELEEEKQYTDFTSYDLELYASDIANYNRLIDTEKLCIKKALTDNDFVKLALDTTIKKATVHMSASNTNISQLLKSEPMSMIHILTDDISIERFSYNSIVCDYAYIMPHQLDNNSTLDIASEVLVLRYRDGSETLYKIYR